MSEGMVGGGMGDLWWVAYSGGVEGPFTQGQLFDAVRMGRLLPGTLVRQGEGAWVPASDALPGAFSNQVVAPARPVRTDLGQSVDVGVSVLLSLITFGIWWFIWVYPRLTWYAERAGRPVGNRLTYFWILVAAFGASIVLGFLTIVLAIPAAIVVAVFGSLLLYELSVDQRSIAAMRGVVAMPATASTVVTLYAVAQGISITIVLIPVSIVLLVFSYLYFFRNHNAAVAAMGSS